jgi:uncharacterized SAM-binding protein YcdF (DUF218 family)
MYDVIIVLGYLVEDNGKLPEEQILRINKGIELLNKKQARNIIMNGGFGNHFNKTNKPLAWYMKEFAMKQGIPSRKIISENKSANTIENILFSKAIIIKHKWKSIIIVSSKYHIPRVKMICKYIFSKDYKLKFLGVKTAKDNKKEVLENERKHIIENEDWLKNNFNP